MRAWGSAMAVERRYKLGCGMWGPSFTSDTPCVCTMPLACTSMVSTGVAWGDTAMLYWYTWLPKPSRRPCTVAGALMVQ